MTLENFGNFLKQKNKNTKKHKKGRNICIT